MGKLKRIFEDIFDDLEIESSSENVVQKLQDASGPYYILDKPERFKYVMSIDFTINRTYEIEDNNKFKLDLYKLYSNFLNNIELSLIDDFYISPFYFYDKNYSNKDNNFLTTYIEPIQFAFPYPEVFDLNDVYKREMTSSLVSSTFVFKIYFNYVIKFDFRNFIIKWRNMMKMMNNTILNSEISRGGEILSLHENKENYPKWQYVNHLYLNGANHNYNEYKVMYKMFFDEQISEETQHRNKIDENPALDVIISRLNLDILGKRIEKFNGEDNITIEYCQNELKRCGNDRYAVWFSYKIHTTDDNLDISKVEKFILKNLIIHIPVPFFNYVTFCIFLKSDFKKSHIICSNDRRILSIHKIRPSSINIFKNEPYCATSRLIEYNHNKKEENFRGYWLDSLGSSDKFMIYFGDDKGKLGKIPYSAKHYNNLTFCVNEFDDVLKRIDNNEDIWIKKK